jgi:hypothetical protein
MSDTIFRYCINVPRVVHLNCDLKRTAFQVPENGFADLKR